MTDNNNLYDPDHKPDPVAVEAARAAVAATEPEHRESSLWVRIIVTIGIILFVAAVAGSVVTAFNTFQDFQQNNKLKEQNQELLNAQSCLLNLVQSFEKDQASRVQIAKDDRDVVDDLVEAAFNAKTPEELQQALNNYNMQRAVNETRRQTLPNVVPTCNLQVVSTKPTVKPSSQTSKPSFSAKPTATPSASFSAKPSSAKSTSAQGINLPSQNVTPTTQSTASISIPVNSTISKPSTSSKPITISPPVASSTSPSNTTPSPVIPVGPILNPISCGLLGICLNSK